MFIPQSTTQATSIDFSPIFTFATTEKALGFGSPRLEDNFTTEQNLIGVCVRTKNSPDSLSDVNQNLSYMNDGLF